MSKNKNKNKNETAPETAPTTETAKPLVITDGKALTFRDDATDDEVLAEAKSVWKRKHVGADGRFITNARYTPFQARRGEEHLLFVYGGGEITLFKKSLAIPCGPRTVWDD